MTVASTLQNFCQSLQAAVALHLPQATLTVEQKRGIVLNGRIELNEEMFIAVYFNALTGKTSYALIQQGRRLAGYDNYQFWHYHPLEEIERHQPCAEPTPEEASANLVGVMRQLP